MEERNRLIISIHSLLAEGDVSQPADQGFTSISIHSLLAEGDFAPGQPMPGQLISIHSLLAEGDLDGLTIDEISENFNPLPPRGGRPNQG